MKLTSIYVTLTILLASTQAFEIFRSSNGLQDTSLTFEDSYPTMPCFAIAPQLYKAFSFWGDLAKNPYTTTIKDYPAAEGETVKAEFVWNMCTKVTYATDCPSKGSIDNGYIRVETTTKDAEEKEVTKIECNPIFQLAKDSKFKLVAPAVANPDKKNNFNVQQFTMTTETSLPNKASWSIKCPASSQEEVPPTNATATFSKDTKTLTINYSSFNACGGDYNKFILFFQNKYVFNAIFILVSIPLVFFGLKFLKVSMSVVGFLAGTVATALVASVLFNFVAWTTMNWVYFGLVCLGVASLIAAITYHSPSMAIIVGSGALGYFGGLQLINLASNLIGSSIEDIYKGAIIAVCVMLAAYIGFKIKKVVIILATSSVGSYLFLFGIGSLVGNYPDIDLNNRKIINKSGLSYMPWVYIGGTLLLFIIGASFQFSRYSKKTEENTDAYNQDSNMKSDDYTGYY